MKVCIYTICKNESKFIERWYKFASEADYICVLDTGSTDDSAQKLSKLNIKLGIDKNKSFRFDEARNKALTLIPKDTDICISIDFDEYLPSGWCDKLKKFWDCDKYDYGRIKSIGDFDKIEYKYRIHNYHDSWHWEYPVHEQLCVYDSPLTEKKLIDIKDFEIIHTPDYSKDRSFYKKLEICTSNEYHSQRSYMNVAKRCLDEKDYDKTLEYLKKLNESPIDGTLPKITDIAWCYLAEAKCYYIKGDLDTSTDKYVRAIRTSYCFRDIYVNIIFNLLDNGDYKIAKKMYDFIISKTYKLNESTTEDMIFYNEDFLKDLLKNIEDKIIYDDDIDSHFLTLLRNKKHLTNVY